MNISMNTLMHTSTPMMPTAPSIAIIPKSVFTITHTQNSWIQVYKIERGANLQPGEYFQNRSGKEKTMTYGQGRTYKKVEVIGISSAGVEDAIQQAITRAQKSLEKLSWFEVQEVRGHIGDDGKIKEYQVTVRIGFKLD